MMTRANNDNSDNRSWEPRNVAEIHSSSSLLMTSEDCQCDSIRKPRFVFGLPELFTIVVGAMLVGAAFTLELKAKINKRSLRSSRSHISAAKTFPPHGTMTNSNAASAIAALDSSSMSPTTMTSGVPHIVWLMSFPNSGTSFTLELVRRVTQTKTATNYGEESTTPSGQSLPVFEEASSRALNIEQNNGPFWINPDGNDSEYTNPTKYVLTKTHCGGRCERCGPQGYVESPHSFLQQCLSGKRKTAQGVKEDVTYDSSIVNKAVHLLRDPFDNVVSRFHLALKKHANDGLMEQYTPTREGFRKFCHDLNDRFYEEELKSRWIDSDILEIIKDVPCRADFYRYVQWHNLAFVSTQNLLELPTLVVHYEDYEDKMDETVDRLLNFLELPRKSHGIKFVSDKRYRDYFTVEEQEAIRQGMERLASKATWSHIQPYLQ